MAEHVPFVNGNFDFTALTSAAVTAGQALIVSATGTVSASGGAGSAFVGVAAFDAASGAYVTVQTGGIHDLVSTGTVTAGALVQLSATAGKIAAHVDGTNPEQAIGIALTTASGNVCRVRLFR